MGSLLAGTTRRAMLSGAVGFIGAAWLAAAAGGRAAASEALRREALPFDPPPLDTLRASPRKVFAHWHRFLISFDNLPAAEDTYKHEFMTPEGDRGKWAAMGGMMRSRPIPRTPIAAADWRAQDMATEVRRAASIGLDGFMFNILQPPPSPSWDNLTTVLDASSRVDPGFRVALMIDAVSTEGRSYKELARAVASIAKHPALARHDGRLVLSAFTAERRSPQWWSDLRTDLDNAGAPSMFVPLFQGWRNSAEAFAPIADGYSDWGGRTATSARALSNASREAQRQGKLWMAPVAPQVFRPKDGFYAEAENSRTFREMWRIAIEEGADWVHIITWNDYGEGTEIAPSVGTQYAFYDLAAYFTTWFKTGVQPPITRDVLYYFHRVQRTDAAFDRSRQQRPFELRQDTPARDEIELLAFLTAPGVLEIHAGQEVVRRPAPAGITSVTAPLAPGLPRFRLLRGGRVEIDFPSAFLVAEQTGFQDLLYRAGSSSRPPVPAARALPF